MTQENKALAHDTQIKVTTLGEYLLPVECVDTFSRMGVIRPQIIVDLQENAVYQKSLGKNIQQSEISALTDVLAIYSDIALAVTNSTSLNDLSLLKQKLKSLENCLDENKLGCFMNIVDINLSDERNKIDRMRIDIDIKQYKEKFNTTLPEEVFYLFCNPESGLSQSIQGTMAASELLSTEEYEQVLSGELNLVYPGCGSHFTPLIIAFDLISRGSIERANLLMNDKNDMQPALIRTLQILESRGIISGLILENHVLDATQIGYKFKYLEKDISVYCLVEDMNEVTNWNPGGRPLNVVYEHIPYQSASPGVVTEMLFAQKQFDSGHEIAFILAGTKINIDKKVLFGKHFATNRIKDVSFADKNSWIVDGDPGVGLTVVKVTY